MDDEVFIFVPKMEDMRFLPSSEVQIEDGGILIPSSGLKIGGERAFFNIRVRR